MSTIKSEDCVKKLISLNLSAELRYLPDDIFISSLDIFDIHDLGLAFCDHASEDHRDSGSQIPARYHRSSQRSWSEEKGLMRIHDCHMPLHLLDLDEPVQTTLEEDFMDTRHPICLSQEDREGGLKIRRKSWKNIRLKSDRTKS